MATFGPSFFYQRIISITDTGSPAIIIALLATTARSDMHAAGYVFGTAGIINQTGGWNTGLAFLFGLLSVQWTVGLYFSIFQMTCS